MPEQVTATTAILNSFTPAEATEWGLEEQNTNGGWDRLRLSNARYWPIAELSVETIADRWAPLGTFRLSWYKGKARRHLGSTGPLVLDERDNLEPEDAEEPEAPWEGEAPFRRVFKRTQGNFAAPAPRPPANDGPPPGAHVAANLHPQTIAALSPEQLQALLTGATPADPSPLGQLRGLVNLHGQTFDPKERMWFELIRSEQQRQLDMARADAERRIAEAEHRAAAMVEQTRLYFQSLRENDQSMQQREREMREYYDAQRRGDAEELRAELEELATSQETVQQALARTAQEQGLDQQQTQAWVQALAPIIPRIVELLAARASGPEAGRIAGQMAGAATHAAIPQPRGGGAQRVSAGDLFDAIAQATAGQESDAAQ